MSNIQDKQTLRHNKKSAALKKNNRKWKKEQTYHDTQTVNEKLQKQLP